MIKIEENVSKRCKSNYKVFIHKMLDETYYPPPTREEAIQEVIKETGADHNIVILVLGQYLSFGSNSRWIQFIKPDVIDIVRRLTEAQRTNVM